MAKHAKGLQSGFTVPGREMKCPDCPFHPTGRRTAGWRLIEQARRASKDDDDDRGKIGSRAGASQQHLPLSQIVQNPAYRPRASVPGTATWRRASRNGNAISLCKSGNARLRPSGGGVAMTCRVLFVTPEFEDYVRVGGLASVSAALPRAMKSRVDVRLLLPGYREVLSKVQSLEIVGCCPVLGEMPACSIGRTSTSDGLAVYVAICPELYERDGTPYADEAGRDWRDNDLRFARLSSAAAFLAAGQVDPDWRADILHANDWPSAMAPAYLAWNKLRVATILTIHNLAYQGLFPRETLRRIGAPDAAFAIDSVEFYNEVSFLKSGLVYADHLTTVSATYAREITTPQFGCRLEGLLRKRAQADQLTGIDESWDPRNCPDLETPFGAGDWQHKRANANHIRREFNLALSRGPLFGLVARLVHQKGVDMVLDAAETIVAAGGQIVVMGRGEPHFEHALQQAQARRPESIAVAIRLW